MSDTQWKMESRIGPLWLVASDAGLRGVHWDRQSAPMAASLQTQSPPVQIIARAVAQLEEYLNGTRKSFDAPLDIQGTQFQKTVWQALQNIPYGETQSYRQIAACLENGKAFRAVGAANAKNPISIIIPCHRVIAADGTLGGYAGGLEIKKQLLTLEKK